jgi:23S rRNA (uracil1939-C5)-methyltransferase
MPKLLKDDILEIIITDLGAEGNGIGRTSDDFVVFVKNTVPGDSARIKVKKVRKNYAEANLLEIIDYSPHRTEPECSYFGTCNGCKMQNINYMHQIDIKKRIVLNAFERIGGFQNIKIPPILGSTNTYYYRNKLEFSFSNQRWLTVEDLDKENAEKSFALGFHMPGFIDKVLDIKKCYLQSDLSNKILNLNRDFFKSKGETIYSTKSHEGYLRYLIIRQSYNTSDLMVNLITHTENKSLINEYAEILRSEVPEITTFVNSISTSKAQVAQGDYYNTIFGDGFIREKIGDYLFKITPSSFFQTNSLQAKTLFDTLVELSKFEKDENVLDLYCGAGAISIYISHMVNKILGIEMNEDAIEMAKENAMMNGITNCEFSAYDVKGYLFSVIHSETEIPYHYDTIILDPPRSGIHPKSAEYILALEPQKIIYVSCNPATQARDIKLLEEKYDITAIQPVDMFPHTFHIENVARLDRKKR